MTYSNNRLQNLFLLCLGLFAGTAFCMKWMESYFIQDNQLFTIIGLEVTYPKEKVLAILSGLDENVKTILRFHLVFDFAFMAGVYPGIAILCIMAQRRIKNNRIRYILYTMALLQALAWGADIFENLSLLKWIAHPLIGKEFSFYHFVVMAKWVIALSGVIAVILSFSFIKKPPVKN